MIPITEFAEGDLRVGTIVETEPIPGATRRLRVTVDLGAGHRTLVAGVAQSYAPEQLIGIQVVVVFNLEPTTMRGVESQGMLLGIGCDQPNGIALLTPNRPVPNGARAM